jgi:RND family efflux transporter MFP subunit
MAELRRNLDELKIDRGDEPAASGRGARRWLVFGALVLIAVLVWWWSRDPRPLVRTVAARAAKGADSGATVLNASGYVTARRRATVSAKATGKVVEVLIEEGMEVEEGDVLARLDDSNVRAALELARAQLGAAVAALGETEVRLADARREQDRAQRLRAAKVGSQQDLDRRQAEADSLAARRVSEQSAVEVAERSVAVQQRALDDTVIRAPFAGVVVSKDAQPGEMISPVSAGGGFTRTGIGTLVDMESLEVEIDVNEAYIQRVKAGQEVVGTLDAYPGWRIPCHVIAIVPTADRQRATVRVRVGFGESDPRILPDMGIKVAFQGSLGDDGAAAEHLPVLVPRAAIRGEESRPIVFVLSGEQVERRAVSVLPGDHGEEAQIFAGLSAGERVVVQGPADLIDGQRVQEAER